MQLTKATQPTMYFIGVTTGKSSIMKLFPRWAQALGLKGAVIKGIDLKIHDDPQAYRDVVQFIKDDELSMGALVTTHKIDLYNAAKDLFGYLDPYAQLFGELSCISKENGVLAGYAKDPITSGLAMEAFIPPRFFQEHHGEVFLLGAGGSAIAISSYLFDKNKGENIPSKLIVGNRSQPRLTQIEKLVKQINPDVEAEYYLTPEPEQADAILRRIRPYSLIVNATGLGKDRPGSPLTDAAEFPKNSLVWELNYRGELDFMHQAIKQKATKNLHVEDGWIYFIHGWTHVIAEVFHIKLTPEIFSELERIANDFRRNS